MKKSVLFLATLLVSALAHAAFPIEGSWGMKQAQGPLSFDITFTIANNTLTVTNVCSLYGKTAVAQVVTSAFYDNSTLTTNQYVSDEQTNADHSVNCNISSEPGTLNYAVQGNRLILSMPGNPQQMVLVKK